MNQDAFRGVVQGGAIVFPSNANPLADGTPVIVIPLPAPIGSPAAVLAAMAAEPEINVEDVEALNREIAQGHRPLSKIDPFASSQHT